MKLCFPILLFLLLSCSKSEVDYFPLNDGLQWNYHIERNSVMGNSQQKLQLRSLGLDKKSDQGLYVKRSATDAMYHYKRSKSSIRLVEIRMASGVTSNPALHSSVVFSLPLTRDTSWQDIIVTQTLDSQDPGAKDVIEAVPVTAKIISTRAMVNVPAGLFHNCIQIESTGSKFLPEGTYPYHPDMTITVTNTRWYAPGVGLVKEIQNDDTDTLAYPGGGFIKELEAFSH